MGLVSTQFQALLKANKQPENSYDGVEVSPSPLAVASANSDAALMTPQQQPQLQIHMFERDHAMPSSIAEVTDLRFKCSVIDIKAFMVHNMLRREFCTNSSQLISSNEI